MQAHIKGSVKWSVCMYGWDGSGWWLSGSWPTKLHSTLETPVWISSKHFMMLVLRYNFALCNLLKYSNIWHHTNSSLQINVRLPVRSIYFMTCRVLRTSVKVIPPFLNIIWCFFRFGFKLMRHLTVCVIALLACLSQGLYELVNQICCM